MLLHRLRDLPREKRRRCRWRKWFGRDVVLPTGNTEKRSAWWGRRRRGNAEFERKKWAVTFKRSLNTEEHSRTFKWGDEVFFCDLTVWGVGNHTPVNESHAAGERNSQRFTDRYRVKHEGSFFLKIFFARAKWQHRTQHSKLLRSLQKYCWISTEEISGLWACDREIGDSQRWGIAAPYLCSKTWTPNTGN